MIHFPTLLMAVAGKRNGHDKGEPYDNRREGPRERRDSPKPTGEKARDALLGLALACALAGAVYNYREFKDDYKEHKDAVVKELAMAHDQRRDLQADAKDIRYRQSVLNAKLELYGKVTIAIARKLHVEVPDVDAELERIKEEDK